MWWFLLKKLDTENEIVYAYGCETRNVTGEISYDRKTNEFSVIKLADNDTEKGAELLLPHIYHAICKENCPRERMIAIG